MDHFWALIKTLSLFFGWLIAACLFYLFAAYGVDFIGKLFTDHGQTIGSFFLGFIVLVVFALEYIRRLDIEKEKRKKIENSY